ILAFQFIPADRVILEEGDVSPRDIRAPRKITYVSQILTEEARERAEEAVEDVYDPPNARIIRQRVGRAHQVLAYLDTVRYDPYASSEEKVEWTSAISDPELPVSLLGRLLAFPEGDWQVVMSETEAVVDRAMRREIREGRLDETKHALPTLIDLSISEDQADIVAQLAQSFIDPNSFYNAEKTAEAERLARQSVEPFSVTLEEGEVILRRGEIVDALDLEALEVLGLRQPATRWQDIAGTVALVVVLSAFLGLYLFRFGRGIWADGRSLLLLLLLCVFFILTAKLMVPGHAILSYLFPAAALSMLLAILFTPQLAIAATILLSMAVGFMASGFLELGVYALMGGLIASLCLYRVERLNAFLWAGLCVALTNMATILAFRLLSQNYDLIGLLTLAGAGVANGALSASLALGGFLLLSYLFGITTSFHLFELTQPTQPLLHRLLLEASGTYHHSLLVGNMAERAAEQIGANALLARVGAYYHDIGKISHPYFFSENQMEETNVHQHLDPKTSARIIVGHVREGLELARKYKLPRQVQDFIAQHHGTGLAECFYRQALQEQEAVDEDDFR
ncbi:MAG: HDIG domain-containing protein, partial [Chloroflexota bacterium]|nr:HDIG domain-containing protein [Chloroflexota bacterium]